MNRHQEIFDIEIMNWDKYQPKRDQSSYTWLRLSNDISVDRKLHRLTAAQRYVWIEILCQASRAASACITIDINHLSWQTRADVRDVWASIEILVSNQVVSRSALCGLADAAASGPDATPTNERTDERTKIPDASTTPPVEDSATQRVRPGKSTKGTFRISTKQEFGQILVEYLPEWAELYSREYLEREVGKALVWLKSNPAKNKKTMRGWVAFFAGWFDRGWDRSTTRGPSSPATASGPATTDRQWETEATRVLEALVRYGAGSKAQEEIAQALGPELHQIAIRAKTHLIRSIPSGPFQVRTVASMLRTASELIENSKHHHTNREVHGE